MKTLKPIFAAAILSLALSSPAYSDGIIHSPGYTDPPPPPSEETTNSTDDSTPLFEDILLAVISLF